MSNIYISTLHREIDFVNFNFAEDIALQNVNIRESVTFGLLPKNTLFLNSSGSTILLLRRAL